MPEEENIYSTFSCQTREHFMRFWS